VQPFYPYLFIVIMGVALGVGWSLYKRLHAPTAAEIADELAHRGNRAPTTNLIEEAMHRVLNGTSARIERIETLMKQVVASQASYENRATRIENHLRRQRERIDRLYEVAKDKGLIGP
jgi:phage shock protein A